MTRTDPISQDTSATLPRTRRPLNFLSLAEIQADIQNLLTQNNGQIHTIGQLTAAQNIGHIALFIDYSVNGFPFKLPWPLRVFGRMMRNRSLSNPMPTGLKMPPGLKYINAYNFPPADITLQAALDHFTSAIDAASQPGAMSKPSPLLGQLTEAQWLKLHCLHADLHFSFLY